MLSFRSPVKRPATFLFRGCRWKMRMGGVCASHVSPVLVFSRSLKVYRAVWAFQVGSAWLPSLLSSNVAPLLLLPYHLMTLGP